MITWTNKAWEDFIEIQSRDKRSVKKIIELIKDIERNGYKGIGKPESLKADLSGYWSRRIDTKNRIVYKIDGDTVKIVQCGTHYGHRGGLSPNPATICGHKM